MNEESIKLGLMQGMLQPHYLCCPVGGTQWLPISAVIGYSSHPMMPTQVPPQGPPIEANGKPMKKPDNHLAESIFALIICLPFGLISLLKSLTVERLWNQGQYYKAKSASSTANCLNIVSFILFLLYIIGSFITFVAFGH